MAWAIVATLLSGCGQDGEDRPEPPVLVPVQGVVRVDGDPLPGAVVMFLPTDPKGTYSIGETDDEGRYKMTYLTSDGTTAGDYRVTVSDLMGTDGKPQGISARTSPVFVSAMVDAEELLPPRYSHQGQTTLTAKVPPEGATIDIDLEGPLAPSPKPAERPETEAHGTPGRSTDAPRPAASAGEEPPVP